MEVVTNLVKRIPSARNLPGLEKVPELGAPNKNDWRPRLSFFRRRIRLKRDSTISIPLGVVLLFPCLVIALILVLFVRHPSNPAGILRPAGAPPQIRYVAAIDTMCLHADHHVLGKSARNTTSLSSLAA
jgi:mannosyltransferase